MQLIPQIQRLTRGARLRSVKAVRGEWAKVASELFETISGGREFRKRAPRPWRWEADRQAGRQGKQPVVAVSHLGRSGPVRRRVLQAIAYSQ